MSQFKILDSIFATIKERQNSGDVESSYTAKLFARGRGKIAQKLGEEAVETVIDAVQDNKKGVISESADLLFHLLVLWADMGIEPARVMEELQGRKGISGIEEKKGRVV
jgi:phosphoribosyl-ATP pyrophosphohydrolase